MKVVAVFPGKPDSIHLREVPNPSLDEIPDGRGVLVKVLRVGLDGTDREIHAGEYGTPPPGDDYLILGHESFGVVEETGPAVTELVRGDYVVATVRRPGGSLYDRIGMQDMTTDDLYLERGINLRHGFLAEYFVEDPEYLVRIPPGLKDVGVLAEPASVIEKGIAQAFEIQRRMRVWHPRRAAVLGAGPVGLLATMALRLRGLQVCTFGLRKPPYRNADLLREIGGCYHSTRDTTLTGESGEHGPFDLIFEATGYSPIVFEAMNVLGKNGVLVLSSVTGGGRSVEVPADRINLGFVLGNKVVVGTVREDYSADGNLWNYFPHDHARSRTYRFYLDSTPTHSYMKALYKYHHAEFPYRHLSEENRRRGKEEPEFEPADTGIFDGNRYFDIFAEYAKASPDDILIKFTAANRGPEAAKLFLLPTLWFRNSWSWGRSGEGYRPKPAIRRIRGSLLRAVHRSHALPTGGYLEQADGTAWMAFFCSTMLSMAIELAREDPVYDDVASKFFEHFIAIADAMNILGGTGLWDEGDGSFFPSSAAVNPALTIMANALRVGDRLPERMK